MSTIYDKIVQVYRKILGFIDGKADLVNGKVPAGQLPDDWNDVQDFDVKDNPAEGETAFPEEGIAGVLYVEKSTNKAYRWSITERKYVEVGNAAQVQSDWDERDANKKSFIRNKPNVALKSDTALEPVYSDDAVFTAWRVFRDGVDVTDSVRQPVWRDGAWEVAGTFRDQYAGSPVSGDADALSLSWSLLTYDHGQGEQEVAFTASRERVPVLVGYTLGGQTENKLASLSADECARLYPDGSVRSASEFTPQWDDHSKTGLRYDWEHADADNHTVMVLSFCSESVYVRDQDDSPISVTHSPRTNGHLAGRVVIPPYVYHEGDRYTVVGIASKPEWVGDEEYIEDVNYNLESVVAPITVRDIQTGAFHGCDYLKSVAFPGVVNVGQYAFTSCGRLASVSFPAALSVGDHAFDQCSALRSISFPVAESIGPEAFARTAITQASLPALTSVARELFWLCRSLVSVSLPAATSIEISPFRYCSMLRDVDLRSLQDIPGSLFDGISSLKSVYAPAATSIGSYAFRGCTSLRHVDFPSVTSVGNYVFSGCTSLQHADFPSVASIGTYAFDGCTSLHSVAFPRVTTLNQYAFSNCTALESVSMPVMGATDGTPMHYAFAGCVSLVRVSFPALTVVQSGLFRGCTSLSEADFPAVVTLGSSGLQQSSLVSVSLPSVTKVYGSGLNSADTLQYIDFGDTPRDAVPALDGPGSFHGKKTCKFFVPDAQYDDWTAPTMPDPEHEGETKANPWYALVQAGYRFFRHSELAAVKAYDAADFFPTKWADLKLLRDTGGLVPGRQYRITDYVATTNGDMKSASANNPFDIVVTAVDERTLDERARAVMHEPPVDDFSTSRRYYVGDYCKYAGSVYRCTVEHYGSWKSSHFEAGAPYFYNSKLEAWEVWYCLDNDTSRFAWALAEGATDPQTGTTGRGVVYRLVDEFKNDLPYDFKGLKFIPYGAESGAYYTFGASAAEPGLDRSLAGASGSDACCCNTVRPYVDQGTMVLNRIVFKGGWARDNTFGPGCHDITTGTRAEYNTFGPGCYNTIVSSSFRYNSFGNCCHDNYLGAQCQAVVFGNYCYGNILGRCTDVSFGVSCVGNVFGASYAKTFSDTGTCTVGSLYRRDGAFYRCDSPYLGRFTTTKAYAAGDFVGIYDSATSSYSYYRLPEGHEAGVALADTPCEAAQLSDFLTAVASPALSYYRFIRFGDHVTYVCLESTASRSSTRFYQNVTVADGVAGTAAEPKHIQDPNREQVFRTTYQTSDSQVVNI